MRQDTMTPSAGLSPRTLFGLGAGLSLCAVLASSVAWAADRPAPVPMLSGPTGAKPNVMIAMESINHMGNPFGFTYYVTGKNKVEKEPYCPGDVGDGYPIYEKPPLPGKGPGEPDAGGHCSRWNGKKILGVKTTTLEKPPAKYNRYVNLNENSHWHAMRSHQVNPMFYNPNLTYKPRLVPNPNGGAPKVSNRPSDLINDGTLVNDVLVNDTLFISNQDTVKFANCSSNNNGSDRIIRSWREVAGMPPSGRASGQCILYASKITPGIEEGSLSPSGNNKGDSTPQHWMDDRGDLYVPYLAAVSNPNSSTPAFTYVNCQAPAFDFKNIDDVPWNREVGCRIGDMIKPRNDPFGTPDMVEVKYNGPDITLPTGHQRTDCSAGRAATKCTWKEEMRNIANWYRWYSDQGAAISTSLGRVLANPDYQDKMRVGYHRSLNLSSPVGSDMAFGNENNIAIGSNSGRQSSSLPAVRGVRLLSQKTSQNKADSDKIFEWLYRWQAKPNGRRRMLNHSIRKVADYYGMASGQVENPWAADPSQMHSASNPELSCRRSFNILIAGLGDVNRAEDFGYIETPRKAWDKISAAAFPSNHYGPSFDFKGYNLKGDSRNEYTRKFYTPYGNYNYNPVGGDSSDASMRIAKSTAYYYWHKDMRPSLSNDVPPRNGQPTTWQNMTTYTVGYHMKPSREMANSNNRGLTYQQIEQFNRDWQLGGNFDSMAKPKWVARDAGGASSSGAVGYLANPRGIVDDFIQAGYTGGGKGFGVSSPADVEQAFDTIISEIINYRGTDAGVTTTGLSAVTENTALSNETKFTVEYDLTNNSGLLTAIRLDKFGAHMEERWNSSNSNLIPPVASRKFFVKTQSGNARTISQTSTVNDLGFSEAELPTSGSTIDRAGKNFIKYLLGDDAQADTKGGLWRQRVAPIASSVNAPPLYVRARENAGYGNANTTEALRAGYGAYFKAKFNRPGTLYLATNQGLVHVFNAGDSDKPYTGMEAGKEVAAFLLRGSANKLPKFADPAYKFQYLADGDLTEHDVLDGAVWKNIVVGSLGRGGTGLYAIESKLHATAPTPDHNALLWEKTAENGASYENLSSITNKPQSGRNTAGINMLVTTAGHYPASGKKSGLYVLNPMTGDILKFIETPGAGRGLGGVTLIRDAQKLVTGAYAGDANGNLWRFILTGAAGTWTAQKIYSTGGLPIYAAPAWDTHPGLDGDTCQSDESSGACGLMVVVGTGILLDEDDQANNTQQRLIGIWDTTPVDAVNFNKTRAAFSGTAGLVEQTVTLNSGKAGTAASVGKTYYQVSENEVDFGPSKNHKGWYLKLAQLPGTVGERIIGDLSNNGTNVFASSVVINAVDINAEQCSAGRGNAPNVLYGLDRLSGKLKRAFDQDGDNKLDRYSVEYNPAGGFTRNNALTALVAPPPSSVDMLDYVLEYYGGDPKEGHPERKASITPIGGSALLSGTEGSSLVGDGLEPVGGWRRSWRKIENLPASLR